VKKDKAFFFVDYEGIRSLFEEEKVATVPNCAAGFATGTCAITATNPATATAIANTLAIYPKTDVAHRWRAGISAHFRKPDRPRRLRPRPVRLHLFRKGFDVRPVLFGQCFLFRTVRRRGHGHRRRRAPYWHEQDGGLSQYANLEERHILSPTLVNIARMSFSRPTKHSTETSIITAADGSHPLQFSTHQVWKTASQHHRYPRRYRRRDGGDFHSQPEHVYLGGRYPVDSRSAQHPVRGVRSTGSSPTHITRFRRTGPGPFGSLSAFSGRAPRSRLAACLPSPRTMRTGITRDVVYTVC